MTSEDVYANLDLFDRLGIIKKLRDEGFTQQQIGDGIGWSRDIVARYSLLSDRIVTTILDLCKQHQEGRVTDNVTMGTFNFTERWFRDSAALSLQNL